MPRLYSASTWYWKVGNGPAGQVYSSAGFAYVPEASDPGYLAFVADGGVATVIDTEANLRDTALAPAAVRYLAQDIPAQLEVRPRSALAGVRVVVAGQSLVSGTVAALAWSAGGFDPLGMNSGGPAVTIPLGQGGLYLALASASFATNATGDRALSIRKGAAEVAPASFPAAKARATQFQATGLVRLTGGDVVRVFALQDSGGPLTVDVELTLLRVG